MKNVVMLLCYRIYARSIVQVRNSNSSSLQAQASLYQSIHLQHTLREVLIRLPNPQIPQNLLRSTKNRIKLVRAMELLDDTAHARLRESASAEDVDGLVGDLVRGARREGLEEADGAA